MRIGEAAMAAGVVAKTLSSYADRDLLPASGRSANGYRSCSPGTSGRPEFIRRGRAASLTLSQAGGILALRNGGAAPCGPEQICSFF